MVADLTTGEVRDLGAILTEAYRSIKGSAGSGNKVEDLRGQLIGGVNRSARPPSQQFEGVYERCYS
jgi:hypothetical protein